MHAAVAAVAGEPGAIVLSVFALVAGLLLLSGASAHVLLGNSATAARSSAQGVVRVAATVRSVPLPADLPAAVRPRRTKATASGAAARRRAELSRRVRARARAGA